MSKPNLVVMETVDRSWEFVEKYYPNYSSCDLIAKCDDLRKILDGQIEGNAEVIYNKFKSDLEFCWDYGNIPDWLHTEIIEIVKNRYNKAHVEIYEKAINEFLKQQL